MIHNIPHIIAYMSSICLYTKFHTPICNDWLVIVIELKTKYIFHTNVVYCNDLQNISLHSLNIYFWTPFLCITSELSLHGSAMFVITDCGKTRGMRFEWPSVSECPYPNLVEIRQMLKIWNRNIHKKTEWQSLQPTFSRKQRKKDVKGPEFYFNRHETRN
jgi:hypothetical protein